MGAELGTKSPSGSDRWFKRMNLFEGLHRNLNYPGLHFMTTSRADRHLTVALPPHSLPYRAIGVILGTLATGLAKESA